jgi:hypothetical protein
MAKTKAASTRIYNSIRDNIKNKRLHNVTGIMSLTSAVVGGLALTSNYVMTKPYRKSVDNQTRLYLSRLATSNQSDFLTNHQAYKLLTERIKDKDFASDVVVELNNILTDTKEKTADIHAKEALVLRLDQQQDALEQQLSEYNEQMKVIKK